VARLCGPALALRPAGDVSLLGRPARRFTLGLTGAAAEPVAAPPGRSADPDTQARLQLLEGASPLALEGELLIDAATGVPLVVKYDATFGLRADPALRVHVQIDSRVTALGAAVAAVRAPSSAKPDERKPDGPARALEAAGLRERTRPAAADRAAPEDEPAE
jgi:hypothetical protein